MKKIILLLCILFITGCVANIRFSDVETYKLNGKVKNIRIGDEITINHWNGKEQYLNDKEIKGKFETFNGVKIGTDKETVIKKFNLNSKNTLYNCEIDTAGDGTTEVIDGKFNNKIFKNDYLDCDLAFGYNYKDGKMLDTDLIEYPPKDSIVYHIDINGLDEEKVDVGQVILISISKK